MADMEAPDVITLRPTTQNYPAPGQNSPSPGQNFPGPPYDSRIGVMMESPPPNISGMDFSKVTPATSNPPQQHAQPQAATSHYNAEATHNARQLDTSELGNLRQRVFSLEDKMFSLQKSRKWDSRILKLILFIGTGYFVWTYFKTK